MNTLVVNAFGGPGVGKTTFAWEIASLCKKLDLPVEYICEYAKELVKLFNIDIKKGMFLGIAGPSGCGKSSLIKAICKLEQGHGEIFIDLKNINSLRQEKITIIKLLIVGTDMIISSCKYLIFHKTLLP